MWNMPLHLQFMPRGVCYLCHVEYALAFAIYATWSMPSGFRLSIFWFLICVDIFLGGNSFPQMHVEENNDFYSRGWNVDTILTWYYT
jgi:hypothetical protein